MRCPSCDHTDLRVVDSRTSRGGRAIRRRRECGSCGGRFTTYETIEQEPLTIRKRTGASELFERSKLLRSVRVACAKRPVSAEDMDSLADRIEEDLESADSREVDSRRLGELVMRELRRIDKVAYVRYASVYRNFEDTTEFEEEVRELERRAGYDSPGQAELFPWRQ